MHKPTQLVENELRASVFGLMREFIEQRGVELAEPPQTRRIRTIIYSASSTAATLSADKVFRIEHGALVRDGGGVYQN